MLSKILARTSHGICMAFLCLKLSSNLKEKILNLVKSIHARIAEMVLSRYTLLLKQLHYSHVIILRATRHASRHLRNRSNSKEVVTLPSCVLGISHIETILNAFSSKLLFWNTNSFCSEICLVKKEWWFYGEKFFRCRVNVAVFCYLFTVWSILAF